MAKLTLPRKPTLAEVLASAPKLDHPPASDAVPQAAAPNAAQEKALREAASYLAVALATSEIDQLSASLDPANKPSNPQGSKVAAAIRRHQAEQFVQALMLCRDLKIGDLLDLLESAKPGAIETVNRSAGLTGLMGQKVAPRVDYGPKPNLGLLGWRD